MSTRENVTMKDIAERVGVSVVTVSKALNDRDGVSEETKKKIQQLADEMGYRYNVMARSIKEGYSYNIGVIIAERFAGDIQSFYLKFYKHISMLLEKYDYSGILNILTEEDEENCILPKSYQERKVDAFILLGQIHKSYIEALQKSEIPIIFLDFYDEHANVDSVITDNFYGSYEITNYLIMNGHRDIAFVGNLYATSSIQDRFLGYYKSLLEHKISIRQEYIINDRDEKGKFINLTLPKPLPTAFVCNCDQIAYHLITMLKKQGYLVPNDCSVVGFDNDIFAMISNPPLTTVEVDIKEMAAMAIRIIIEKIKNPNKEYGRMLVPGNIIYRDSVKKLV